MGDMGWLVIGDVGRIQRALNPPTHPPTTHLSTHHLPTCVWGVGRIQQALNRHLPSPPCREGC